MINEDDTERITELRAMMLEHLEAALVCADETGEAEVRHLIEQAMDCVRSKQWRNLLKPM